MPNPTIVVNTYDSATDHTNVSFYNAAGQHVGTFGANLDVNSPITGAGGIYHEDPGRPAWQQHTLIFTPDDYGHWNDALAYANAAANATANGLGDYDLIGQNCYDFVDSVLTAAGLPENSAYEYMPSDSLVYKYGKVQHDILDNWDSMWNMFVNMPDDTFAYVSMLQDYATFMAHQDYQKIPGYGPEIRDGDIVVIGQRIQKAEEETWVSPIAIDLDGDGFNVIDLADSAATFDYYGRDAPLKTAWLAPTDGFLVMDRNGDGTINDLTEMFGGRQYGEGYEKLRALDSNQDGVLDNSDSSWNDLRLWMDANSDGISSSDELHGLTDAGLVSLGLTSSEASIRIGDAFISEVSTAQTATGSVQTADLFFRLGGRASPDVGYDEAVSYQQDYLEQTVILDQIASNSADHLMLA